MSDDKTNVLHVWMKRDYASIVKAKGVYLYDDQGNEYIDASGGPILVSLGHGVEEMGEALKKQAQEVAFAYRFDFTTP
ncbi:MAG: aminotransferase class III-fold pyridoxal phosphate-dependent enzyme, partial [Spirochaetales bacterium]|nr:aminotransferase class III-fold pyridoxal phosphate-dependent enzyme [Spirochaetales bacterium]